jgi:hypothetical protein
MRRPGCVKTVFSVSWVYVVFGSEPSRLCRHPSIRTLYEQMFRSVPVACSRVRLHSYYRVASNSSPKSASRIHSALSPHSICAGGGHWSASAGPEQSSNVCSCPIYISWYDMEGRCAACPFRMVQLRGGANHLPRSNTIIRGLYVRTST